MANRDLQPSESIFRRFSRGVSKFTIGLGALAVFGRTIGELFHIDRLSHIDAGRWLVAMSVGAATLLLLRREDQLQAQPQEQDPAMRQAQERRAYLDQHPRSSILRSISLDALQAYSDVLAGTKSKAPQQRLNDSLITLHLLGISPNMHSLDPNDPEVAAKELKIAENPVSYMEWFGGQVLDHFDQVGHTGPVDGWTGIQDVGQTTLRNGYSVLGMRAGWVPNIPPLQALREGLDR